MQYRKASLDDLEVIWNKNIKDNPNDERWERWKKEYIEYNLTGKAITFVVVSDDGPVGEGTLILSSECKAVKNKDGLCDNSNIANINALRIQKEFEGQGHISKLIKEMEKYALLNGIDKLTIGVEAKETRNLAIYLHFGFTKFLFSNTEDGEIILYYKKELNT